MNPSYEKGRYESKCERASSKPPKFHWKGKKIKRVVTAAMKEDASVLWTCREKGKNRQGSNEKRAGCMPPTAAVDKRARGCEGVKGSDGRRVF